MANKLLLVVGLLFALGVACTSAQLGETIDEHANGELFDLFFKQIRQAPADTILVPTTTDTNATDTNTTTPSIAPSAAPSSFPTPAVSPPPAFQLSVTGLPGVTITCKLSSLFSSLYIPKTKPEFVFS